MIESLLYNQNEVNIMKIQDTSSLGRDYSECEEFINICTSAFPTAIELPYTELANYFLDYVSSSKDIMYNSRDLELNAIGMNNTRKLIDNLSSREQQALDSLRSLLSHYDYEKNLSPEVWKSLQQLASVGFATSKERDVKATNLSKNSDQYMDQSINAHEQQEVMKNSIAGMQQSLEAIQHLDIDSQRRIDRVEVTERHMERIDAIPNISSEQKETLKNMLVSYVGMRVESFKAVENFAHKAIDDYRQHKIYADDYPYEYDIAIIALSNLTTSFSKDLYETIHDFNPYVSKERWQADITAMNMFRDYQKNGMVDRDLLIQLSMMHDLHPETYTALSRLDYHATKNQNSNLSAMLQDSSTTSYVETSSRSK